MLHGVAPAERKRPRPWGAVAAGLLFLGACTAEETRQADVQASDCQEGLIFQSATFYAGATDHYFTDSQGRSVSFRIESDRIARSGFAGLVTRGEEGPPDTAPAMVGRSFTVCRSGDGYELRPGG